MRDKHHRSGPAHPRSRLTSEQVRAIRAEYQRYRRPLRCFAERFNVHQVTVWRVVQGYSYFDDDP